MDLTSYIQETEHNLDRALDESEIQDIDLWLKGRELLHVVGTEAWEIIIATLHAQADDAKNLLLSLPPGDERVAAVHGTAAGVVQAVSNFEYAIKMQIAAARTMPEVLKSQLRGAKEL